MNIQRDTEYRFGELVQSPEYSGYSAEEQDTIEQGPLGELKQIIKDILIQKGVEIKGKTELKFFADIAGHDGEDPIGGPLVLIDNTGKKYGVGEWWEDEGYVLNLYNVSCEWDYNAVSQNQSLEINDAYTNSQVDLEYDSTQLINNPQLSGYEYDVIVFAGDSQQSQIAQKLNQLSGSNINFIMMGGR